MRASSGCASESVQVTKLVIVLILRACSEYLDRLSWSCIWRKESSIWIFWTALRSSLYTWKSCCSFVCGRAVQRSALWRLGRAIWS